MKLAAYKGNGVESVGVLTEKGIIDIPTNWPGPNPPRSIIDILRQDAIAKVKELAGKSEIVIPIENVKLLAPISRPGKILALAGNYGEHIKEASIKTRLQTRAFRTRKSKRLSPDHSSSRPPLSSGRTIKSPGQNTASRLTMSLSWRSSSANTPNASRQKRRLTASRDI